MPAYKVLLPLDGSPLAAQSLAYLPSLQGTGELSLLLLRVTDGSDTAIALTYLDDVSLELKGKLGAEVETRVLPGAPAQRIIEEAERFSPDLLVISTHGRSGLSRWRFGSVADKVIRGAGCSTMVIGPNTDQSKAGHIGSLLVPLDGSPLAEAALPLAQSLAQRIGAEIYLLRVVETPMVDALSGGDAAMAPQDPSIVVQARELLDSLTAEARDYLQGVAKGLGPSVQFDVVVGSPDAQISAYAEKSGLDLVIMTSHGRGGILRSALGSVSDRLLGGPVPVIVDRSGQLP